MISVSIIGATGYAGIELTRLLTKHPNVKIKHVISQSYAGKRISDVYPSFRGILNNILEELSVDMIAEDSDVVFTALPHGASKDIIPAFAERGVKIIDLSADFRYNSPEIYEKWYGLPHGSPELLKNAVYGLCEIHRNEIKKASIVGNPGCYTTCSILALAPLLKYKLVDTKNIIIDAKSGVTGAGRGVALDYHFCECTENIKAYKVSSHRHTSEIEQELSILADEQITLSFTPHLIPMKRGILATCYANLLENKVADEIINMYKEFYKNEYFVRVYDNGTQPETKYVAGSNFVDIGITVDKRLNRVIVVSCLDNLIKGAAGQAIQNMNLMLGMEEKEGIDAPAFYL